MLSNSPEQVRPLAPRGTHITSDEESSNSTSPDHHKRNKRRLKCVGCVVAFLLIQAIVIIVLAFTVFKVKDPTIRMNNVTVLRLDLLNATTPRPGSNMTLSADVSVKNPNFASFRYKNTTTTIYYKGVVIGEARGPPGKAKARRTMRMNVTVDVITDRVINQPGLAQDIGSGLLTMSSYTVVGGKVKVFVVKKHVTVRMNCTMTIDIQNQNIQQQKCKRKVKI